MSRNFLIIALLGCALVSGMAFMVGSKSGGPNDAARQANATGSNAPGSKSKMRRKTKRMYTSEPSPEKGKRRLIMKNVVLTDDTLAPLDQRSLKTLLTEMASMMDDSTGGFDINRMLRVMGMNSFLGPDDVPAALEFAKDLNNPQQKQALNNSILKRWADFDGEAAMNYAVSNLSKDEFESVTGEILRGWAGRDPLGAYQWLKDSQAADDGDTDQEYSPRSWHWSSVFSGLAGEDLDFAWEEMRGLTGQSERNAAMRGIAGSAMMEIESQDIIWNRLSTLDNESERTDGQRILVQQVAQMDPQRAASLVTQLEESPTRNELVSSVAGAWMLSDVTEAGNWMLENTPEDIRSEAVTTAVQQRAFMDPEGTVDWLDSIGDRVDTQPATLALVNNLANMDPARAWNYLDRIEDESARMQSMRTTYENWSSRNSEAAAAALAETGITLEDLQQSPPPSLPEAGGSPFGGTL